MSYIANQATANVLFEDAYMVANLFAYYIFTKQFTSFDDLFNAVCRVVSESRSMMFGLPPELESIKDLSALYQTDFSEQKQLEFLEKLLATFESGPLKECLPNSYFQGATQPDHKFPSSDHGRVNTWFSHFYDKCLLTAGPFDEAFFANILKYKPCQIFALNTADPHYPDYSKDNFTWYGRYSINVKDILNPHDESIAKVFTIVDLKTKQQHTCTYYGLAIRDQGILNIDYQDAKKLCDALEQYQPNALTTIHCSSGVGRTAHFFSILKKFAALKTDPEFADKLLRLIQSQNEEEFCKLATELGTQQRSELNQYRQVRYGFQTKIQQKSVYSVLLCLLAVKCGCNEDFYNQLKSKLDAFHCVHTATLQNDDWRPRLITELTSFLDKMQHSIQGNQLVSHLSKFSENLFHRGFRNIGQQEHLRELLTSADTNKNLLFDVYNIYQDAMDWGYFGIFKSGLAKIITPLIEASRLAIFSQIFSQDYQPEKKHNALQCFNALMTLYSYIEGKHYLISDPSGKATLAKNYQADFLALLSLLGAKNSHAEIEKHLQATQALFSGTQSREYLNLRNQFLTGLKLLQSSEITLLQTVVEIIVSKEKDKGNKTAYDLTLMREQAPTEKKQLKM